MLHKYVHMCSICELCNYLVYYNFLYDTFTEFRSNNSNWESSVPVHPGLSLHKSQPDYSHVRKHYLDITGKLPTYIL